MMKNVLLLGKTGLLGSAFFKQLSTRKDLRILAPTHQELDLLDFDRTRAYITGSKPDLIIHCVAYTNVEKAEEEPEACDLINVEILKNLLQTEVPIIHFSSDYVFDVSPGKTITEDRPTNPLNYYGLSKQKAEHVLQQHGTKYWNIRTSWLFGEGKGHFISKILYKASTHESLDVVCDQIGRPTYAQDLAATVIKNFIEDSAPSGHYHLQNSGDPISWADLAVFVLKEKGLKTTINHVDSKTYPTKAQRPKNSVLTNTKLAPMRDWKRAVEAYLKTIS